jgi:phosphatidate cytidylyltransferase
LEGDLAPAALVLAVFVPKFGDIGAYFAGRLFGKTPMAPRLSPKKTWEGFMGGLILATAVAVLVGEQVPIFPWGRLQALIFGVVVGSAGVVGDLAESLMKRDAALKDAGQGVPGFGGVLDVIDSVLFAAPLSYWLLCSGIAGR